MSALPKPTPCHQNWLAMTPTAHGRRCGQCDQEIRDFSALSWPEIERVQAAHGNALCGMYAPAQLRHWGRQPPPACAPLAAVTALAATLTALAAHGQAPTPAAGLTLYGTVAVPVAPGKAEPIPFASVTLAGTTVGTLTDEQGQYRLALPDSVRRMVAPTVVITSLGFCRDMLTLPAQRTGLLRHDAFLTPDVNRLTVFSVRKPTLLERLGWTLKRWFSPGSGQ